MYVANVLAVPKTTHQPQLIGGKGLGHLQKMTKTLPLIAKTKSTRKKWFAWVFWSSRYTIVLRSWNRFSFYFWCGALPLSIQEFLSQRLYCNYCFVKVSCRSQLVVTVLPNVCASGGGQYGDVYEGYWKRHERTVAVKTLKVIFSCLDKLNPCVYYSTHCFSLRKTRWLCTIS